MQTHRLLSRTAARTNPSSSVPYSVLTKFEMKERMKKLHDELRRILKQRNRLHDRLEKLAETSGVTVDEQMCGDLKQIIASEGEKMMDKLDANSFQHTFWKQQVMAASKGNARGIRWHPLMIRWCIYLRHLSQSAYETLRQSKCIILPSQRTLRDYTHHLKPTIGYSSKVDEQLYQAANIKDCEMWQKHVILLLDEMHIKEDLVFDKHTGELVGFVNLGQYDLL